MSKLFRYIFIVLFIAATAGYEVSAQIPTNSLVPTNGVKRNLQPGGNKGLGKKIEAARDKFLSQQLDLTDDEADKFWPLYHQYQEELKAVRILKRINSTSASGSAQIDKELYYDNQMLTIKKKYLDEFLKIIPSSKISILYKSERAFNDEVIKQLSERSIRAGN
ncbi:hypothetical protein [Mucilaginibacter pedocola]|uniref:Sensor of ECF-type sigma factor n=1 Tax=Mucilaginibacter pedocola TaxID=1792845 RepID=A0A1S9PB63_9SPHI|nr:hypothetical protein [Mucilaginibacter pedocola]OOQ58200.1 hypothetical protein BC343_11175 [Mucilaginibacter pedocola]